MNVDVRRYAAFTDDPASGNPAGVVPDAGQLTDRDMLSIAAGVGYSETAFITKSDHQLRRFAARYFSPRAEVPFCGHATIAAAVEITRRAGPGELMLDTQAGEVPVHTTPPRKSGERADHAIAPVTDHLRVAFAPDGSRRMSAYSAGRARLVPR